MSAARERSEPTVARQADPVSRARAVAPIIAAAAARIEAARELTEDVLEALHGAALFRTLLPRAIGGEEVRPATYVRMMMALAAADASAAWCLGQSSGCSMAAAYVAPEVAREVWGGPRGALAWGAVGNPDQIATVVDGGYRVAGTWPFASGGRHATWLGGHCRVKERDGTLRRLPDGGLYERTMLFPRSAVRMIDAWQVMGLRGTGSDTYSVQDLFVPEAYTVRRDVEEERRPHGSGPLYRFSTTHLYASGFAGVALGIARAMLDDFLALACAKTPSSTTRRLCDSPVLQSGLARAEARWRAARFHLLGVLDEAWDHAAAGEALTLDHKVAIRLAATAAIHEAKQVADFAYAEAGATAIFESQPFERRFRDIHAVTQQLQGRTSHFETVGAHLMGLPVGLRFL